MNLTELDRALRRLRLSGMADVLGTRLRHAQTERLSPLDLVATLVSDELQRRQDRLFDRRHKQARFTDIEGGIRTPKDVDEVHGSNDDDAIVDYEGLDCRGVGRRP